MALGEGEADPAVQIDTRGGYRGEWRIVEEAEDTYEHGVIASSDDSSVEDHIDADLLEMVELEAVGVSGHHEVIRGELRGESECIEESVFGEDAPSSEVDSIARIDLVYCVVKQEGGDIDGSLRDTYRYWWSGNSSSISFHSACERMVRLIASGRYGHHTAWKRTDYFNACICPK